MPAEAHYETANLAMRGRLLHQEPMSAHTSWRVGGPADTFFTPADIEDLSDYLAQLDSNEEIHWIGLGSNLLVRDGGIRGTVISVTGVLNDISLHNNGIEVGAGLTCARAARFSAQNQLGGAEFLAGIPGTIGGALAMNAGAFGSEVWDIVSTVRTINRRGEITERDRREYKIGYRSVKKPEEEYFVSAKLDLNKDQEQLARKNIKNLLSKRAESQPIGEHSCGSVFRNPEGDHAARLIEACGLKGYSIGGAIVSTKHANFIINSGTASATDIESLINHVQQAVSDKFTIQLQTEVCIVGEGH